MSSLNPGSDVLSAIEARRVLARLLAQNLDTFTPRVQRALQHAVNALGGAAESSGGPVQAGFVAVLQLPGIVYPGRGKASGLYLPDEFSAANTLNWNRQRAFQRLFREVPEISDGNTLAASIARSLGPDWAAQAPAGKGPVMVSDKRGNRLRLEADPRLFAIQTDEATGQSGWDLAFGADEDLLLERLAVEAIRNGITPNEWLPAMDPTGKPCSLNLSVLHDRMIRPAQTIRAVDEFMPWLWSYAQRLYQALLQEAEPRRLSTAQQEEAWETLSGEAKGSWVRWIRAHPGIQRLELALRGFFANGGTAAMVAVAVSGYGTSPISRRSFLEDSFDHVQLDRLCAPGLNHTWQGAILDYANASGRIAIVEAPRYLLSKPPPQIRVNEFRWIVSSGEDDYECLELPFFDSPEQFELRLRSILHASPVLDRAIPRIAEGTIGVYPWLIVDNPLSIGEVDRYTIAPPSGHAAALYIREVGVQASLAGTFGTLTRLNADEISTLKSYDVLVLRADT